MGRFYRNLLFIWLASVLVPVYAQVTCPKNSQIQLLEQQLHIHINGYKNASQIGMPDVARKELQAYQSTLPRYFKAFFKQEATFFTLTNEPRCLMSVFSQATGANIQLYRLENGTWGLGNEGRLNHQNLSAKQVVDLLKPSMGLR